jgi:hypothetical protein
MYTATVPITIAPGGFNPIGSKQNIAATLGGPNNTSAGGPDVFSGDGQSMTITVPPGYTGSVQLTFQLPSSLYVLVGIAVVAKTPPGPGGEPATSTGRRQFRTVMINRDTTGSQMIVTDACSPDDEGFVFDYVLLVQATSEAPAFQGQIGLIDPDIDTETGT